MPRRPRRNTSFLALLAILLTASSCAGACALLIFDRYVNVTAVAAAAIGAFFLLLIWPFLDLRERDVRRRAGRCLKCGYDLRASGDRCPECGFPVRPGGAGG
jgi:hypothetical protein